MCGNQLGFARTGVQEWVYWVLCVIAVYIVRSLSFLVLRRLDAGAGVVGAVADTVVDPMVW